MKKHIKTLLSLVLILFALLGGNQLLNTAPATENAPAAITAQAQQIARNKKKKAAPTATRKPTATPQAAQATDTPDEKQGPITDPQEMVNYIAACGKLPDNFITKAEAKKLGWDSYVNYVGDVAPGMSIGGDRFGNYEGQLPTARGRSYTEADCYYTGGKRNACRLIFSNDGLYFYTEDHYKTFVQLYPQEPTSAPTESLKR